MPPKIIAPPFEQSIPSSSSKPSSSLHCLLTDGGQIRVGGLCKWGKKLAKKRQKKGVFATQWKHNHGHLFEAHVIRISLVNLFHSASTLLHLVARPSCRGAVGHGRGSSPSSVPRRKKSRHFSSPQKWQSDLHFSSGAPTTCLPGKLAALLLLPPVCPPCQE